MSHSISQGSNKYPPALPEDIYYFFYLQTRKTAFAMVLPLSVRMILRIKFSTGHSVDPLCVSKRSTFCGYKKASHVRVLPFQQLHFFVNSPGVPGQAAVCPDHAVAWNDNRYFVVSDRTTHRLGSYTGATLLFSKLPCDLTIGSRLPIGYPQENVPHRPAERRADGMQRRRVID